MKTLNQFLNEAEVTSFHREIAAHHRAVAAELRKKGGEYASIHKKDAADHEKIATHIENGKHGLARRAFNKMDTASRDYAFTHKDPKHDMKMARYHRITLNADHPKYKDHEDAVKQQNDQITLLNKSERMRR